MDNSKKHSKKESKKSMEIKPYSRLASLPIHSENIFHFPEGLPAFDHIKEFIFICKPDTVPFLYMHALDPADITFVCIDPFLIYPNYKPRISEADVSFLHLDRADDVLLLSIVTVKADVCKTTANLQGPIAINMQASIGKQIVCENQNYPLRYQIWDTLNNIKEKEEKKEEKKALGAANV